MYWLFCKLPSSSAWNLLVLNLIWADWGRSKSQNNDHDGHISPYAPYAADGPTNLYRHRKPHDDGVYRWRPLNKLSGASILSVSALTHLVSVGENNDLHRYTTTSSWTLCSSTMIYINNIDNTIIGSRVWRKFRSGSLIWLTIITYTRRDYLVFAQLA